MKEYEISQVEEPGNASPECQTSPPYRILVVDDDDNIRRLSSEVLIHHGYQVDSAEDGAAGWEALHARRYDLLITDNNMPKVTGVELLQKMHAAHMAIPVILVAGMMPMEQLNRHPWLLIDAALLKPFTLDDLLGTVKEVLRVTEGARDQMVLPPNSRSNPSADGLWLS